MPQAVDPALSSVERRFQARYQSKEEFDRIGRELTAAALAEYGPLWEAAEAASALYIVWCICAQGPDAGI
jgi:hypothetical protein